MHWEAGPTCMNKPTCSLLVVGVQVREEGLRWGELRPIFSHPFLLRLLPSPACDSSSVLFVLSRRVQTLVVVVVVSNLNPLWSYQIQS